MTADSSISGPGDPLTVWTARALVAGYVAAVSVLAALPAGARRATLFRTLWTAAWLVAVIHVFAAFDRVHHWRHSAAWEHTAEQTARVVGWAWGGGVVVNYVFLAWWTADVAIRWARRRELPAAYEIAMHSAFAFLIFNATAVFGPPFWRWTAALVIGVLAALRWRRARKRGLVPAP